MERIAISQTKNTISDGNYFVDGLLLSDEIVDIEIEVTEYTQGLRGLHIDEAHWGTLPPMFNGWQICGLTIEQITPRLLCVNPERYIKD